MGLMRRRPLLRAAAVSAGSYYMGKHKEREQAAEPAAAPQPQPASSGPSSFDQLEQLGRLHEQGVLTDEEFAQQKAKVLGS